MARAVLGETVIAESDEVISIEGVAYFPPESVRLEFLTETGTRTGCPWRGIATYYTVAVGEDVVEDGAWRYLNPKRKARRIAGWVAFWKAVRVDGVEETGFG